MCPPFPAGSYEFMIKILMCKPYKYEKHLTGEMFFFQLFLY